MIDFAHLIYRSKSTIKLQTAMLAKLFRSFFQTAILFICSHRYALKNNLLSNPSRTDLKLIIIDAPKILDDEDGKFALGCSLQYNVTAIYSY